jgi:hypothetical protein
MSPPQPFFSPVSGHAAQRKTRGATGSIILIQRHGKEYFIKDRGLGNIPGWSIERRATSARNRSTSED